MQYLKQSTGVTIQLGAFVDETDGFTAETGLTITQADVRLSKNGAAFAQANDANAAAHDENGWYRKALDATDTATLGRLVVAVHESGARPVSREFMVVPANEYDSLISGSDALEVDVALIDGGAYAFHLKTMVANCMGADSKVLISTDAQDLSGSLDVNAKKVEGVDATDQIRDAVLAPSLGDVTSPHARSATNALRHLRNKWTISGGTLTVTKEDDSTEAWTGAVTTNSGAEPVTEVDPT